MPRACAVADAYARERLSADVGLSPGIRRRTPGLRRDEVAGLAAISTDYYTRLEQQRGPHPSAEVLASLARALRLTDDERDHLFHLAGQAPPSRHLATAHLSPGLLHLLDRLTDCPAMVVDDLGVVLRQNTMSLDADVANLVNNLNSGSAEFAGLWAEHVVAVRRADAKRIVHPEVGLLDLMCETLVSAVGGQTVVIFYPRPGTGTREKLDLLRVIGLQDLSVAPCSSFCCPGRDTQRSSAHDRADETALAALRRIRGTS